MKSYFVLLRLLHDAGNIRCVKYFSNGFRYFSSLRTHYDVLGLSTSCSNGEIKKAYVELCKQLHPDMKPGDNSQHKKFIELNSAYTTLINAGTRRSYDRNFRNQASGNSHSSWRPQETSQNPFYTDAWNDETIWHHKKNSSTKFHEGSAYHGVKRLANGWIVAGCFILILIGNVLYFSAYSFATNYTYTKVDARSRRIGKAYFAAKEKAREIGKEKQLEKLHKCWGIPKNMPDNE